MHGYLLTANAFLLSNLPLPASFSFLSPLLLPLVIILASPLLYTTVSVTIFGSTWIFWLFVSLIFGLVQAVYVVIQFGLIFSDVVLMTTLKTSRWTVHYLKLLNPIFWVIGGRSQGSSRRLWRKMVEKCTNWKEYEALCATVGIEENQPQSHQQKQTKRGRAKHMSRSKSVKNMNDALEEEISKTRMTRAKSSSDLVSLPNLNANLMAATASANNCDSLNYDITSICKRNLLGVDDVMSEVGRLRTVGEKYTDNPGVVEEIGKLRDATCDALKRCVEEKGADKRKLLSQVVKTRQSLGSSALMLSGGGSITMYHLGTVKALIESNTYSQVKVVSGTSGGSIAAAMCAIKTEEELLGHICVNNISTDYKSTGEQGKLGIRWFPTMWKMAYLWVEKGLLVESEEFRRCCYFYYGDMTFEEAYEKTKKHVCITVSASRAASDGTGTQRLLLNHITTPHVTVASAVTASCALPGVMAPAKLDIKVDGVVSPFEVDGVEWIDGSVQADIPFKRISTLFNVTNFIVCQCNFHVVPFLPKAHGPGKRSTYWRLFQMLEWDIRSRVLNLSRLGLFPKLFGQDVSKIFKQKYEGHVTIVPKMNIMQVLGIKALLNPTVEDMKHYLQNGQMAAWPYIEFIRHSSMIEGTLRECVRKLEKDLGVVGSSEEGGLLIFDVGGGGGGGRGGGARSASKGRETELLRRQVKRLSEENSKLKQTIKRLSSSNEGRREILAAPPPPSPEEKKDGGEDGEGDRGSSSPGWTTVTTKKKHRKSLSGGGGGKLSAS
ncbi:hypothetical protein TL16_g08376 [Triparma laevis f. inornata]|uniref:PNPLA domain-containing protein n=1 Tax=Triparma laevis f. inornata TaxID=1714386 RepID=A0A9W7B1X5_9STRA|nr:hypothetical protein TL16_g08376 [Triparma laevis f. inornata]